MRIILIIIFKVVISRTAVAETYTFVGSEFPSILESTQNGQVKGLGVDIAKIIAHKLGHDIKFKIYPWKRALLLMEYDRADVLIGPYKSTERENFLHFNKYPFYQDPIVFYVRENDDFIWNGDFSTLNNKKIGITSGWSFGAEFDLNKEKLDLHVGGSVEINIKKLLLNRIDLFISHPRHVSRISQKLGTEKQLRMVMPPLIINNGFFGFSKKKENEKFINQFDQVFKEMIDSGEIMRLSKKYALYVDGDG